MRREYPIDAFYTVPTGIASFGATSVNWTPVGSVYSEGHRSVRTHRQAWAGLPS
jgi:hypothetical protein